MDRPTEVDNTRHSNFSEKYSFINYFFRNLYIHTHTHTHIYTYVNENQSIFYYLSLIVLPYSIHEFSLTLYPVLQWSVAANCNLYKVRNMWILFIKRKKKLMFD